MKRMSPAGAILDVALAKWEREGWRVNWFMQSDRRDPKKLAEVVEEDRVVQIYPHPGGIPPSQTGLHELLHIVFGLDGDRVNEEYVYYLEGWIWKRLNRKQRERLAYIFVGPLQV